MNVAKLKSGHLCFILAQKIVAVNKVRNRLVARSRELPNAVSVTVNLIATHGTVSCGRAFSATAVIHYMFTEGNEWMLLWREMRSKTK